MILRPERAYQIAEEHICKWNACLLPKSLKIATSAVKTSQAKGPDNMHKALGIKHYSNSIMNEAGVLMSLKSWFINYNNPSKVMTICTTREPFC